MLFLRGGLHGAQKFRFQSAQILCTGLVAHAHHFQEKGIKGLLDVAIHIHRVHPFHLEPDVFVPEDVEESLFSPVRTDFGIPEFPVFDPEHTGSFRRLDGEPGAPSLHGHELEDVHQVPFLEGSRGALLLHFLNHREQLIKVKGLFQIADGAPLKGLVFQLLISVGGHHDGPDLGLEFPGLQKEINATDVGHPDVGDEKIQIFC